MTAAAASAALHVLALNGGSSTLKFGFYEVDTRAGEPGVECLLEDTIEGVADRTPVFDDIAGRLEKAGLPAPQAIGHRVVHGGPTLRRHCLIDETVLNALDSATAFAPLHAPAALSVIRQAIEAHPGLPQAACFDTCFHAGMPEVARRLPLPTSLRAEGLHRYGFHGLSCESIVSQLARENGGALPGRLIVAHLGNGASVTAIADGRSVDTSMGLTPTGGIVMGTRTGDLDPGVLVWLMREKRHDASAIERLVNKESGLLGISGLASDLRELHQAEASHPDARLAIEMFCLSARKQIAAMISVLDGVDLIVFTGGIGEHDARVRATICEGLRWIGAGLDETLNRATDAVTNRDGIQASGSRFAIRAMTSQEDARIAGHTAALVAKSG